MPAFNLGPLYSLKDNVFFPSLTRRQPIPSQLASAKASQQSVVGLGTVKAACRMLHMVNGIGYDDTGVTLHMLGSSGPHILGTHQGTWYTEHLSYLTGMLAIADLLVLHHTMQHPNCAEFARRWQDLLATLTQERGTTPPYNAQALISAASNDDVTNAMMAATDALYYAIKAFTPAIENASDPQPRPIARGALETIIYGQPAPAIPAPPPAPTPATPTTGTVATLQRLIRRGGTALLVGPTGVGKTYAVKQAVVAEGARLVIVKGRPGLDDRQLYGGIYPTADHYQWIDGPLAKAWRAAHAGEHVVLIIDELARLDPYHLAALIGALDPVSGSEVRSMQLPLEVDDHTLYYVLSLPNGDNLVAPCRHLSIVATTNLGSDYAQLHTTFDAALLRRFSLQLDIESLSSDVQRHILVHEQHLPQDAATVLVASAEFSTTAIAANGGLLQRELNLGTLINWAAEARALVDDGTPWADALRTAADLTAIPFACPRLADGRIEVPAAQMLREHLDTLIRDHLR